MKNVESEDYRDCPCNCPGWGAVMEVFAARHTLLSIRSLFRALTSITCDPDSIVCFGYFFHFMWSSITWETIGKRKDNFLHLVVVGLGFFPVLIHHDACGSPPESFGLKESPTLFKFGKRTAAIPNAGEHNAIVAK
jgi:hypothetical protein